ncbi:MAG: thiosulfate sulfurtransferase, partial [Alphaproteobacteria bacterium]
MNARVVLVDDDGVRAPVTAFWWHQFGWYEVALLDAPFVGQTLETGAAKPAVLGIGQARPKPVSAADAAGALARGEAALIDLSSRDAYRAGHPVGSAWALRSRLVAAVQALQPPPAAVILTSDDGVLARLAAAELETAGVSVA